MLYVWYISSVEKSLCLLKSLSWFERCNTVPQWIQVAVEKCKMCIKNAVADDEPIPVNGCVQFSRSAFHTEGFLRKLGNFWKNLEWPEPLMSSCYAVMTVNGIAECGGYYVSEYGKRLGCIEEHFDEKKVSQKVSGLLLCIHTTTPLSTLFLFPSLTPSSPFLTLPPFPSLPPSPSLSLIQHNAAVHIPEQCESYLQYSL